MSLISENVYIDKLADKYKSAYHKIIKMKPTNVKSSTYIDFGENLYVTSKGYANFFNSWVEKIYCYIK